MLPRPLMYVLCGVLLVVLGACAHSPQPLPAQAVYVVSSRAARPEAHNALTIVDGATWTVVREIALPKSLAFNLRRDPRGHLWIPFKGRVGFMDNRVQVYRPSGELVQELYPCNAPMDVSFAAGRAFVVCQENGFRGRMSVLDLDTLHLVQEIDIQFTAVPTASLLLRATAASGQAVLVTGSIGGESRNLVLMVLDPHTLTFLLPPTRLAGGNVEEILLYQEQFYLLNGSSWHLPNAGVGDVLQVTPGAPPITTPLRLAPGPLQGALTADGVLYAYHEQRQWPSATKPAPFQTPLLSRMEFASGAVTTWDLPDVWRAFSDIAIINGEVILAGQGVTGAGEGLYRFDPATGQTSLLVAIPNASAVVGGAGE